MDFARLRRFALLPVTFAIACGGSEHAAPPTSTSDPPDDGGVDAGPDAPIDPPAAIGWEPCPIYSDGSGDGAQCATVEVPLRWSDREGDRIELFVKRVRTGSIHSRQLWFLNGGPGGPGADYEPLVEALLPYMPDTDMYLLDHRGTGRSSRLGCPAEDDASEGGLDITAAEWPACIEALEAQWGDRLDGFTTTQAAEDLAWLIEETREQGQEVHVHGGSYGTYWAQRLLQVRPSAPDAVSLLGIAPPTISFVDYDYWFNEVGKHYLEACGADAFCAAKLGADPVAKAGEVFAMLDAGHCPAAQAAGFDRGGLRRLSATLVFFSWEERVLVPAMLHRLHRCAPGDVAALTHFAETVSGPFEPDVYDRLQAPVLGMHIGLSELWADPAPDLEELSQVVAGAYFSTEVAPRFAPNHPLWPRYTPDRFDETWAETEVPMLMMNGSLDPATPLELAAEAAEHFAAPNQPFVVLPGAAHSWDAPTSTGAWCSLLMFLDFALDPTVPVDQSCVTDIQPLAFDNDPALALGAFGTSDLWENGTANAQPDVDARAASQRIRRLIRNARRARGF
jgi:pimeloyl-ACP methyl ester carboxylesterase